MKKLLESELPAEEPSKVDKDTENCVDKISKPLAETFIQDGGEATGVCAEPTKSGGVTSVRDVPTAEANLLTFSRQKLAMLQCEYDPKCCSCCSKSLPTKELKACGKCRTAKYCSRECQIKGWETKHKVKCREIRRLKAVIEEEGKVPRILHATPIGRPWLLESNNEYYKLVFLEQKAFLLPGYADDTNNRPFYMYDASTGNKEGTVCQIQSNTVMSICAVKTGHTHYLAISYAITQFQPWRIDFWPYPETSAQAAYTYYSEPFMIGQLAHDAGKLLVSNVKEQTIRQFDFSSFPIKATG